MSHYRKIVWNEGMLLMPHHFQQWDNYHEELLNTRLASLAPYGWGLLDLHISEEAMANGNFEIVRCSAIMPDGLALNIPETDLAPKHRSIQGHFDPMAENLDVYLGVPAKQFGGTNFQVGGND